MRKLGMKLGSNPLAYGALKLDHYVAVSTASVPASLEVPTYDWGMLGNDEVGDCVPASEYHIDESMYVRRGKTPHPYQTPECIQLYSALTGYIPGNESTDNGTDPSAAMAAWVTHGLPGHKLAGFGVLPPNSPNIRRAIWEFGGVMLAVALPTGAQRQGVTWRGNALGVPGGWGGHAIAANGFTPDFLKFVSWGEEGDMDNPFAGTYLEQVLVPLSRDALNSAGIGPAGFNFTQMRADLPPQI